MEVEEIRKFIKSHYPDLDEILFFEMHQTEILLFEMAKLKSEELTKLKAENEELKLKHAEAVGHGNESIIEIAQLKDKLKEVSIQAECYHNNEEMHQGNGSVYVTCKDCGINL